jgi:hypothetical protein
VKFKQTFGATRLYSSQRDDLPNKAICILIYIRHGERLQITRKILNRIGINGKRLGSNSGQTFVQLS